MSRKKESNAIHILHKRYYEGNPERKDALESERINAKIERMKYRFDSDDELC